MSRISTIAAICLVFLLATVLPAAAQQCPPPGSGVDGVVEFEEACTGCEDGPAITCNGEFSIELINFERELNLHQVTFTYDVYKIGEVSCFPDLSYWVLGLDQLAGCLAEGFTLADLATACSIYRPDVGEDCYFTELDPATQLGGLKFDAVVGDNEGQRFTVTLDETFLARGLEIGIGCVVAATKAGAQDINCGCRPVPGYVCIPGPVCEGEPGEFLCPKSKGFWKNHPGAWPVDSLMLGCQTYTMRELLVILKTPPRGDASLILAHQLIAAKLNVAYGSDPAPINDTIDSADGLLCCLDGKLPYHVRTYTRTGKAMTRTARVLDEYNNGWLTPDCIP